MYIFRQLIDVMVYLEKQGNFTIMLRQSAWLLNAQKYLSDQIKQNKNRSLRHQKYQQQTNLLNRNIWATVPRSRNSK